MDTPLPFVSVVVAAQEADDNLDKCLASLARLDYPPDHHEVILVGCGLTPRTDELARRNVLRYVCEPGRGVGFARNAGVEAGRGEIVAFTDADCAVSTTWLRELIAQFVDARVGAVAGAIVPYPPTTDAERYAARRLSHSQLRPLAHPDRPFAMTPNLAFRRDAFDRIGAFDTSFPGGGFEDADLCWRLARDTELELRYAPRAVVFHRYRTTPRAFFVQHYRYGYGLGLLYRKYPADLALPARAWTRLYSELAVALWRWGAASVLTTAGRKTPTDLLTRRYDLLRLLGQRTGMLRATLRRPLGAA